ncbi:MAG: hypothetical protein H7Z70_05210 [Bacteroidia bacterium]|nr:hypothetical protein [Methylotenera sp.]
MITLTWQDGAPVSVNSPDDNDALTFLLTNTGNGQEAYSLTRNNAIGGGNYNPQNATAGSIYLETNGVPGLQIGLDTPYNAGVNDPDLAANTSQVIYILSKTPNLLANGSTGNVQLKAASDTKNATTSAAGKAPGTTIAGAGTGGIDAVVGMHSAEAQATGSYILSGLSVNVTKTVTCNPAPVDCSKAATGTVLNYQLQIILSGAGTATGLVVTDPMPTNVTYLANSIAVGGTPKTDALDADDTQFTPIAIPAMQALANSVVVNLSNQPAPNTFLITFRATIN